MIKTQPLAKRFVNLSFGKVYVFLILNDIVMCFPPDLLITLFSFQHVYKHSKFRNHLKISIGFVNSEVKFIKLKMRLIPKAYILRDICAKTFVYVNFEITFFFKRNILHNVQFFEYTKISSWVSLGFPFGFLLWGPSDIE